MGRNIADGRGEGGRRVRMGAAAAPGRGRGWPQYIITIIIISHFLFSPRRTDGQRCLSRSDFS